MFSLQVEKLVDSWNSYSNDDFLVFPDHLYGIFYADASCEYLHVPKGLLLCFSALVWWQ